MRRRGVWLGLVPIALAVLALAISGVLVDTALRAGVNLREVGSMGVILPSAVQASLALFASLKAEWPNPVRGSLIWLSVVWFSTIVGIAIASTVPGSIRIEVNGAVDDAYRSATIYWSNVWEDGEIWPDVFIEIEGELRHFPLQPCPMPSPRGSCTVDLDLTGAVDRGDPVSITAWFVTDRTAQNELRQYFSSRLRSGIPLLPPTARVHATPVSLDRRKGR